MAQTLLDRLTDSATHFIKTLEQGEPGLLKRLRQTGGYALLNRLIGRAVPFARRNHFQVLAVGPGYLKATIPLQDNQNHFGSLYAGAMFLLAEIPGGVLPLLEYGSDYVPILKEMTLSFRKPAQSDVTVEFHLSAQEIERIRSTTALQGKCNFLLSGELRDQTGELVALSQGTYQLRRKGWYCGA